MPKFIVLYVVASPWVTTMKTRPLRLRPPNNTNIIIIIMNMNNNSAPQPSRPLETLLPARRRARVLSWAHFDSDY